MYTNEKKIALASTEKILELTILPTTQCNFRCKYCYVDFNKFKMREEERNAIKEMIKLKHNQNGLLLLNLKWFGGEPLLGMDVIRDISSFALKYTGENGIQLRGDITTNASLLTPSVIDELLSYNIRSYQITVDGDDTYHNILRPYKGGKPSYEKVISGLNNLKNNESFFSCVIRLNVSKENLSSVKNAIKTSLKVFLEDSRFSFSAHKIGNYSGNLEMDLFGNESDPLFGKSVKSDYICYAAKLNAYVISPHLDLLKCTVKLDNPSNTVGKINPDGSISLNIEKIRKWSRGLITREDRSLHCPASEI